MSKWILKAVVQKAISYLPYKSKINYLFQRYVTKGVLLSDEHFVNKLTHAADHISYYRKYAYREPEQAICLELGTGWYPVVPVSLFLAGFSKTVSIDIASHITRDGILNTLEKMVEWRADEEKRTQFAHFFDSIHKQRWQRLLMILRDQQKYDLEALKQALNLDLLVKDARSTGFPDDHFDLICSNNTFEHIYADVLFDILKEFKRIVKRDGVMSHFIDLSDHFAHFDRSITIYNFLRFSDRQWELIDNAIQPQNRLRFQDYRDMYQLLGIKIREENCRPGSLEELASVPLDKKFRKLPLEEVAISHGYIVSSSR